MVSVELMVSLKIPDVTALTAANALRRRMGYAEALKELGRADYYRLDLAVDDADAALALAKDLAEHTNLFVNPNKHVYELKALEARDQEIASENGAYEVKVLVTDPADGSGEGMLAALQGRLGYADRVKGLLTGTLWTLTLVADDAEQARQMAEEIAVTEAQSKGLLVNPHYQEYEVW